MAVHLAGGLREKLDAFAGACCCSLSFAGKQPEPIYQV